MGLFLLDPDEDCCKKPITANARHSDLIYAFRLFTRPIFYPLKLAGLEHHQEVRQDDQCRHSPAYVQTQLCHPPREVGT